jgi:pentose-5-phosphate-3-epimerase
MASQLAKIKNIKENYIKNKNIELEVDGGINTFNANAVKSSGATIAVAGTSTFINNEYAKNIQELKN